VSPPNDGGPAFPSTGMPAYDETGRPLNPWAGHGWAHDPQQGMSLRDLFAAAALTGLCGNSTWLNNVRAKGHNSCETAAGAAYEAADAMLAAREVKEEAQ
jgi:hypothetical protein